MWTGCLVSGFSDNLSDMEPFDESEFCPEKFFVESVGEDVSLVGINVAYECGEGVDQGVQKGV